ncbi:MAG: lipopolysaccharide biosynthesis protein [Candidatus Sumerlaeia bacterium]|nr:lipopolysaccharide biosynthesis protein [Candidatus Sumerlaeia bacterium]
MSKNANPSGDPDASRQHPTGFVQLKSRWRSWLGGLSGGRRLTLSIAHIAFSNWLRTFLVLVSSLVVARILGPELMGHYATARLLAFYAGPIHLGAPQGAEQQVPILRGAGDDARARDMKDSVFTLVLVEAGFLALFGAIVLLLSWTFDDAKAPIVLGGGAMLAAATMALHLVNIDLYVRKQFRAVSMKTLAASLVTVVSLPLVAFGLLGAVIRQIGLLAAEALAGVRFGKFDYRPCYRADLLRTAIRIGLPVCLMAFLQQYLTALDRTLVRVLLGAEALGIYAIAAVVSGLALALPQAFSNVLYPTVGERYGQTGDARQAAKDLLKPLPYLIAFLLPAMPIGVMLLPYPIELLLPSYVAGIPSARVAVLVCGFSILGYPTFYFYIVRRLGVLLGILSCSLVVQVLVSFALYHKGVGLVSFMIGTALATLCYAMLTNGYLILVARGRIVLGGVPRVPKG